MARDPTDDELAAALDEAEYQEAARLIEQGEHYAAKVAANKRRRREHKRRRARRLADESEDEYQRRHAQEKLERHRLMPYPTSLGSGLYDPSDPRNNTWGNHTPMLMYEKQHMERVAREWLHSKFRVYPNFAVTNLRVMNNTSLTNMGLVESVTWVADVTNGQNTRTIRVLHNPKINGERSVIFVSGAARADEVKQTLW